VSNKFGRFSGDIGLLCWHYVVLVMLLSKLGKSHLEWHIDIDE